MSYENIDKQFVKLHAGGNWWWRMIWKWSQRLTRTICNTHSSEHQIIGTVNKWMEKNTWGREPECCVGGSSPFLPGLKHRTCEYNQYNSEYDKICLAHLFIKESDPKSANHFMNTPSWCLPLLSLKDCCPCSWDPLTSVETHLVVTLGLCSSRDLLSTAGRRHFRKPLHLDD